MFFNVIYDLIFCWWCFSDYLDGRPAAEYLEFADCVSARVINKIAVEWKIALMKKPFLSFYLR